MTPLDALRDVIRLLEQSAVCMSRRSSVRRELCWCPTPPRHRALHGDLCHLLREVDYGLWKLAQQLAAQRAT